MTRDATGAGPMAGVRTEIDRIDRALVALLVQRAAQIDRAVEVKRREGLPARIDVRVDEVIGNARAAAAAAGLDPDLAAGLWRQIVEWSIAREERSLEAGADG